MIRSSILTLLALAISLLPITSSAITTAKHCRSLHCVRLGINAVDSKIITLLKKRLRYVARAGALKKGKRPVHDSKREARILKDVARQGKAMGIPSAFTGAVFKTILAKSNQYERRHQRMDF